MNTNENPLGLKLFTAKYGRCKFDFLQVPLQLLSNPVFKPLCYGAILLYGLILRRVNLSAENYEKYADADGKLYIIYTIEQICDDLSCGSKSAVKYLSELERIGLVKKARQGLTKPNIIYPYDFSSLTEQLLNCKNYNSGIVESTTQELQKVQCSNIDNSYIEYRENIINQSINETDGQLTMEDMKDRMDNLQKTDLLSERQGYEELIKQNIEYDYFISYHEKGNAYSSAEIISEILTVIVDTVCSTASTIRVNGNDMPQEVVKATYLKLNSEHIEYVLSSMNNNSSDIKNIRNYLITTLYNAVTTIDTHITAQCKADGVI